MGVNVFEFVLISDRWGTRNGRNVLTTWHGRRDRREGNPPEIKSSVNVPLTFPRSYTMVVAMMHVKERSSAESSGTPPVPEQIQSQHHQYIPKGTLFGSKIEGQPSSPINRSNTPRVNLRKWSNNFAPKTAQFPWPIVPMSLLLTKT